MISICLIVKDEEENLKKCLSSISKLGYEIVVVDTGSRDNSKKIALEFTDKVFDYKWNNNFSDARNFSIGKATNDYVLIIDADEEIIEFDKKEIEKIICEDKVGRILRINKYSRNNEEFIYKERVNRLFNKKNFEYEGRIHEQVINKNYESYNTVNIPLVATHSGYENNEIDKKNKVERNILLLKEELKINGDDPYILYQLGKSYYMDQRYDEANIYFNRALEFDLDTRLEYVIDMVESYGYSLINDKRYEDAMMLLGVYDEFKTSADFIFLIALIYMNNGMFNEAINEFLKVVNYKDCKMEGVTSYLAYYNLGVINECLGRVKDAIIYYKKCGTYPLANSRLKSLVKGE